MNRLMRIEVPSFFTVRCLCARTRSSATEAARSPVTVDSCGLSIGHADKNGKHNPDALRCRIDAAFYRVAAHPMERTLGKRCAGYAKHPRFGAGAALPARTPLASELSVSLARMRRRGTKPGREGERLRCAGVFAARACRDGCRFGSVRQPSPTAAVLLSRQARQCTSTVTCDKLVKRFNNWW